MNTAATNSQLSTEHKLVSTILGNTGIVTTMPSGNICGFDIEGKPYVFHDIPPGQTLPADAEFLFASDSHGELLRLSIKNQQPVLMSRNGWASPVETNAKETALKYFADIKQLKFVPWSHHHLMEMVRLHNQHVFVIAKKSLLAGFVTPDDAFFTTLETHTTPEQNGDIFPVLVSMTTGKVAIMYERARGILTNYCLLFDRLLKRDTVFPVNPATTLNASLATYLEELFPAAETIEWDNWVTGTVYNTPAATSQ